MTKCVQVCVCLRTTENLITLFKVLNSIDIKIRLIINSSVIFKERLTVAQSGVFISFLSILFRVIVLNGTLFNNGYSIQIYFKTTCTHTCVCVHYVFKVCKLFLQYKCGNHNLGVCIYDNKQLFSHYLMSISTFHLLKIRCTKNHTMLCWILSNFICNSLRSEKY